MSSFLQSFENFLGNTGDALAESDLAKRWGLVKAGANALWDSDMNKVNRAVINNTVVPALSAIAPVVDAPMNAIQGSLVDGSQGLMRGFMQEEDYNYGQALPESFQENYPNITGSVRNVGEVLGDPLNVLTGGAGMLLKRGSRSLDDLGYTPESTKGMYLSQPSNYIDDFYGDSNPDAPLSKVEQAMYDNFDNLGVDRVKGLTHKNKRALAKKVSGFSRWAVESLKASGKTLFDPEAKALFSEMGINKSTQKILEKELKEAQKVAEETGRKVEMTKPFQKAVAQVLFQDTVPKQAGRVGGQHKSIEGVVDSATLGGVMPLNKGRYMEAVLEGQQSTKATNTGKQRNFKHDEDDLAYAYDSVLDIWGIEDIPQNNLVVKKSQGSGGDHATDAIKDNPSRNISKAMFKVLEDQGTTPTIESMYNAMDNLIHKGKGAKRTKRAGMKVSIQNPSLEHAKKHGLWVVSSRSGKGIKEGGINVLTKIHPNMTTTTHISDVHNFLENIPVAGQMVENRMPHKEITITPPIYTDLRDQGAKGRVNYSNKTSDTDGNRASLSDLEKLATAKANPKLVQGIRDTARGKVLGNVSMYSQFSKYLGQEESDK